MKKSPDSYRHGNLAEALVEDALLMLKDQPADELSLRVLAERAGVSPRAPYVHYPTRRDLLRAVAFRGFAELADRSEAAGHGLVELGKVYVGFAVEHPHLYRLMFGGLELSEEECHERQPGRSFQHVLESVRQNCPQLGEPEVAQAGIALWALVHGLSDLLLAGLVPKEIELGALTDSLAVVLQQRGAVG